MNTKTDFYGLTVDELNALMTDAPPADRPSDVELERMLEDDG